MKGCLYALLAFFLLPIILVGAAAVHCGSEEWLQELLDELYEENK